MYLIGFCFVYIVQYCCVAFIIIGFSGYERVILGYMNFQFLKYCEVIGNYYYYFLEKGNVILEFIVF